MYPTSGAISAVASRAGLAISYPPSRAFPGQTNVTSTQMTFLFGGFPHVTLGAFMADADATLPGLRLLVSGNVVRRGARALVYGASAVNGLAYYNLTYAWTAADLGGEVPQIVLEVEKT